MGKFKNLRVWQDAMNLTEGIYRITRKDDFRKDYGLSNQIQRASVSIASNVAEGDERGSNREAIHFFNIAKGSAAEVITQLNIAYRIGYIDEQTFIKCENQAEKVRASLKNLIKSRGGKNKLNVISWFIIGLVLPIT